MRVVLLSQLSPGMISAQDILSNDNRFILKKGTLLTDTLITRLAMYGVLSVAVENFDPFPLSEPDSTSDNRIRNSPEFKEFRKLYIDEVNSLKESLNAIITKNAPLEVDSLIDKALKMLVNVNGRISIFDMLHNMHDFDDSTYSHCLNVGLICYLFAGWLKMSKKDVELATACGLLHDLGKLLVNKNIIQKPASLTSDEFEEIKKHPLTGYHLLREQGAEPIICNAALMHHERCDGSGYPSGLKDSQIDRFAKMVAIVDVYDAMTSSRVYRGPMCPFRVIEVFEENGFQKYDANYLLIFLEYIVNTYIANPCRLSDGRTGTIILINKQKLSRPIVKCGDDFINLADYPDLYIESLL